MGYIRITFYGKRTNLNKYVSTLASEGGSTQKKQAIFQITP